HTATHASKKLGDFGPDGWNRMLDDMRDIMADYCKTGPTILLGHSMGSLLAQQFVTRYGDQLDALVLSGSPGFSPKPLLWLGLLATWWEHRRLGPLTNSPLLEDQVFGSANKPFDTADDTGTGFEWLTTDSVEVKKYIDDPWCGFVPFPASLMQMNQGILAAQTQSAIAKIPKDLPIYVFSGELDPLHGRMRNIERMLKQWARVGIEVTLRIYKGGRHELLNDLYFDEVTADLVAWLNENVGSENVGSE
ncbi:MAG: alpha/beta hydrolase, partial [Pseudomonadota bacterium]